MLTDTSIFLYVFQLSDAAECLFQALKRHDWAAVEGAKERLNLLNYK